MSPLFGRRPAKPDPALLARVSEAADVELGSYSEAVLAVTGAYPARGELDPRPDDKLSAFRRLDAASRQAAMRAALDQLIGDGTLGLPAGQDLEDVVADGLDGKLPLTGDLGDLYRLALWYHRHGFLNGMVVSLALPDSAPPPGYAIESCYAVPADDRDQHLLLVERVEPDAGIRRYALRTLRRQVTGMTAFLFPGAMGEEQARRVDVYMNFRFGERSLKVTSNFVHQAGEDFAIARVVLDSGRKKKDKEPRFFKVTRDEFADGLIERYQNAAARTQ